MYRIKLYKDNEQIGNTLNINITRYNDAIDIIQSLITTNEEKRVTIIDSAKVYNVIEGIEYYVETIG